jgi:hypothetical protein
MRNALSFVRHNSRYWGAANERNNQQDRAKKTTVTSIAAMVLMVLSLDSNDGGSAGFVVSGLASVVPDFSRASAYKSVVPEGIWASVLGVNARISPSSGRSAISGPTGSRSRLSKRVDKSTLASDVGFGRGTEQPS